MEDRLAVPETQAANLERAEQQARLEAAIRALPDRQRVPLVLFHCEDRSKQLLVAGVFGRVGVARWLSGRVVAEAASPSPLQATRSMTIGLVLATSPGVSQRPYRLTHRSCRAPRSCRGSAP